MHQFRSDNFLLPAPYISLTPNRKCAKVKEVAVYTRDEKLVKIARYKAKRAKFLANPGLVPPASSRLHQVRKLFADKRPRLPDGTFAPMTAEEKAYYKRR